MMIRIRTFGEMEIFTTNGLEGRRKKQVVKYDKAGFKMNKQLRKDSRWIESKVDIGRPVEGRPWKVDGGMGSNKRPWTGSTFRGRKEVRSSGGQEVTWCEDGYRKGWLNVKYRKPMKQDSGKSVKNTSAKSRSSQQIILKYKNKICVRIIDLRQNYYCVSEL